MLNFHPEECPSTLATGRAISIIVPFYKNAELAGPLMKSLLACREELSELNCTVTLINDSPGDAALATALEEGIRSFPADLPCEIRTNDGNWGFLRSANWACRQAVARGSDALLLNSDTLLYPGAVREMQRVANLDSMIGFVSPRSNNATICTFPQQSRYADLSPDQFNEIFQHVSAHLPEFHYVPTCVGFCLYINHFILSEVGFFDEVYGKGYSEENDLIMRANRFGYRAVLANRAFVYHIGEMSFRESEIPKSVHERRNFALLTKRYPEYREHISDYFRGAHWEAERLIAGLIPDGDGRIDVAFDCSHVSKHHNGTFHVLAKVIQEAALSWGDRFNIHVIANEGVAEFHQLTSIPGVLLDSTDTNRVFGIAYRVGQPFDYKAFLRLSRLAPVNVYAMLDTIAWDCLYLNRDQLDELWRATARYADGLLYISDFSQDQFRSRFPVRPGMAEMASYLSLAPDEYLKNEPAKPVLKHRAGSYLLLVGNSFAHKYVEPTVKAIARRLPRVKLVALGLEAAGSECLTAYGSGKLGSAEVAGLYAGSRAVIFPSTYEGFGMPVLEALAHRKVLYARDTVLNRALHARLGLTKNIILYDSTESLVRMLASGNIPAWTNDLTPASQTHDWAAHARDTKILLEQALEGFSYGGTLMPRLGFAAMLAKAGEGQFQRQLVEDDTNAQRILFHQCGLDSSLASSDVIPAIHELKSAVDGLRERTLSATAAESEIASLRTAIKDREAQIETIKNSVSWNVTAPLRSACDVWLKLFGRSGK